MSRLTDTRRAYAKIADLLDEEIKSQPSRERELKRARESLRAAFYLLGWAQFEHHVRRRADEIIAERGSLQTVDRHAWRHMKRRRDAPLRTLLDIVFHARPTRPDLKGDYERRNEIAHDYKLLPKEAPDLALWFEERERLIDLF